MFQTDKDGSVTRLKSCLSGICVLILESNVAIYHKTVMVDSGRLKG